MKYSKIEFGRQGNFIFVLLLIHFVFFGYISNTFIDDVGNVTIGTRLLFLYQILFNPSSYLSFILLFGIVFFLVFREQFFEYGIRNSIWLLPFILVESWLWYWIIYGFDITIIGAFFIRIEGWITIASLLSVILTAAIVAAISKERYKKFKMKVMKL